MLQITKSNHIPVQLQTPILAISTYGYIKSSSKKVLKPIIKLYVRIIQNYYKVLNSYICALK